MPHAATLLERGTLPPSLSGAIMGVAHCTGDAWIMAAPTTRDSEGLSRGPAGSVIGGLESILFPRFRKRSRRPPPKLSARASGFASVHSVDNMDTATEYVHSFVSSLFGAEPAPEPLPWYLEWWVFFGFYVSRIIWQAPLVPKVLPRTRPALAAAQRLAVHHRQRYRRTLASPCTPTARYSTIYRTCGPRSGCCPCCSPSLWSPDSTSTLRCQLLVSKPSPRRSCRRRWR